MEAELVESDEKDLLRKEGWYLGELGEEASNTILDSCDRENVFVVYKSPTSNKYTLSIKGSDSTTNMEITNDDNKKYKITGQPDDLYDTVIDAVNSYTRLRNLSPALGRKKALEQQFSISSLNVPPEYDEANRQLQPDIAPLPKIKIRSEKPKEAKTGPVSSSVRLPAPRPDYMDNPHWWRYRDKCCCHPKNTWHFCCYRESYWDDRREAPYHSWYNLCGRMGYLRRLLLLLLWCFIAPFICIGICCFGCCLLIFLCGQVCTTFVCTNECTYRICNHCNYCNDCC